MIVVGLLDQLVGRADHRLGLLVELVDARGRVALQADLLHVDLPLLVGRPLLGDRGEEPVREPLGDVVRDLLPFEAAHVAGGAGGHGHVPGGQLFGRASRFMWAFWALNRTPCFDSW